ncbi:SUN domain-containing protein 1-like isoform X9 [Syngnathoides biaculeatus]|uniref:SUN domain-containing protein 1-like isoform X9 n=1 Tax=Syngnathoides biaculeatus TaxID=300417 RepID=UPI002ADDBECA|nr:SUN domain-containing protein 1-like isoform X9 [Syngnathoides biaculeatus]
MSGRSLRLDGSRLDRDLPLCGASCSAGGNGWTNRGLKSRRPRQLSASRSESFLAHTPRKPSDLSLHGDVSDASLLSSLLDESAVRERSAVDAFWDVDHDLDPKESTMMEEQSSVLANSTLIDSDGHRPKHSLSRASRKDRDYGTPKPPSPSERSRSPASHASDVRCGDRSRRAATACPGHGGGDMSAKREARLPIASLCKPVQLGAAFQLIGRRWRAGPLLTRRFPLALFLFLLTLFGVCWFSFAGLPVLSVLEWKTSVSDPPALSSVDGLASSAARDHAEDSAQEAESESESGRLARLERSVASLRESVEAGAELAEKRHGEMLELHSELRHHALDGEVRLSGLVERRLARLRRRMDTERRRREQELLWQQTQTSRLDLLEATLQNLAAEAEEAASRAAARLSDAAGVAVDRQSHDALLAEVGRLGAALEDIGRKVEGLPGCQRLDQETISAQVHQEVSLLLSGWDWDAESGFPDSLRRRYVAGPDSRASLAALERGILRNVSRRRTDGKAVTREDVDVIVKNALRLFSHDRTGMADYALESGGGSILSTRCSETYETKAALLSLFGVPLWYFSQSPRVVIQPNVQPGNCWAFRGSAGFLVIRLSMRVVPSAFSLEHIPKSLAPSGTLRSAPRHFAVSPVPYLGRWSRLLRASPFRVWTTARRSEGRRWARTCTRRTEKRCRLSTSRRRPSEPSRSSKCRCCPTGATRSTRACTASECTVLPGTSERTVHLAS